jgi:hypothetical protein
MYVEAFHDSKQRNIKSAESTFKGRNGSVSKDMVARNGANSDQEWPEHVGGDAASHGPAGSAMQNGKFQNPYGACNFIVTWDGENVRELLAAIQFARQSGDRFIQDKLIEYILNIPYRNPRPKDIPAFVGKPIWAVDKQGRVLIGMPGSETIVDASDLREQMKSTVEP